jgi:hypothetical protein
MKFSRALMLCGQVWRYAVASGIIERDITVDLKGALTPYRGKHFAAIVDPEEFGKLLIAIDNYHGGVVVKSALRRLAPLVFQRLENFVGLDGKKLTLMSRCGQFLRNV